jgi:hypothetical protein
MYSPDMLYHLPALGCDVGTSCKLYMHWESIFVQQNSWENINYVKYDICIVEILTTYVKNVVGSNKQRICFW